MTDESLLSLGAPPRRQQRAVRGPNLLRFHGFSDLFSMETEVFVRVWNPHAQKCLRRLPHCQRLPGFVVTFLFSHSLAPCLQSPHPKPLQGQYSLEWDRITSKVCWLPSLEKTEAPRQLNRGVHDMENRPGAADHTDPRWP